jgi:hypothetical protein
MRKGGLYFISELRGGKKKEKKKNTGTLSLFLL